MRRTRWLTLPLASLMASTLGAQSASCSSQPQAVRDACQKGLDLFVLMSKQLDVALGGGGPIVGTARTVDGAAIALRVTGTNARVPSAFSQPFSVAGAQQSTIATTQAAVLLPSLDAALTLVPGVRAGGQRVMTIDLLASVVYLRRTDLGAVAIGPQTGTFRASSFHAGYGARVGLLAESRRLPAVSISYLRRGLPRTDLIASAPINVPGSAQRDTITLAGSNLRAEAFRLALSKRVGRVEIGGGVGEDRYRNTSQLSAMATRSLFGSPLPPDRVAASLTRSHRRQTAYGSLGLTLGHYHVGADMGAVFGGDEFGTFNTFDGHARGAARGYASLGLRYAF